MTERRTDDRGKWSVGSLWHRWDPHIHTPATTLNNQFGPDAWDKYIDALNGASPVVEALGITDYCSLEGYKQVMARRQCLTSVKFLFPNVELRLATATKSGAAVNIHLIWDSAPANHVELIEGALARLQFSYDGSQHGCSRIDLIRLGRAFDGSTAKSEEAAYERGVEQFKIPFEDLRKWWASDHWVREHCLIALAAGKDGSSGLKDGGLRALREEIERFAHIMFSGNPSDRDFWLARGKAQSDHEQRYGWPKPCLHGSDAHELARVLRPDEERYCWVKGDLSFEGLRQTLAEPEARVWIGPDSPTYPPEVTTVRGLRVTNAPWLLTPAVALNPGMVAIIGPKGSGKTALADLLAVGAAAFEHGGNSASFINKAAEHLSATEVCLDWADGSSVTCQAVNATSSTAPSIQYLSQQFVQRLTDSNADTDPLVEEIERVVFESLDTPQRMDARDFGELRQMRTASLREEIDQLVSDLTGIGQRIADEDAIQLALPAKRQRLQKMQQHVATIRQQLAKGAPPGKEEKAQRLTALTTEEQRLAGEVAQLNRRAQAAIDLQREITNLRGRWHGLQSEWRQKFGGLGLSDGQWALFLPTLSQDADKTLAEISASTRSAIEHREGSAQPPAAPRAGTRQAVLLNIKTLQAELGALAKGETQFMQLTRTAADLDAKVTLLTQEVANDEKSVERKRALRAQRREAYAKVFGHLAEQQTVLEELYAPIGQSLMTAGGAIAQLSFLVERRVDLDAWVERGERLIDLRKRSAIHGRGTLRELAAEHLLPAWRSGNESAVTDAMEKFVDAFFATTKVAEILKQGATLHDVGNWLFATDHIKLSYAIRFGGVDVERLSPGMRGIALLVLYLGVDVWDTRPLVIDQPEENLDPRSVYTDLVQFFRDARQRRQIILVTHNANLVVNTDVDQVIVAASDRKSLTGLPEITYVSGGLDNPDIRKAVCSLLEGGERAFLQRERRYGLADEKPPAP